MVDNYHSTPNFVLLDIVSYEEILRLALDNLRRKKGKYYSLMKQHIINYEKLDTKMQTKVKKIIIFIQKFATMHSGKKAIKCLDVCLNELGAANGKNLYTRLCCACIKYSESKIIATFLSVNC